MPRRKQQRSGPDVLPETNQVQTLRNYLGNFFPDALFTHGQTHGYETTASATIQLLDQLRTFQRKEKEDAQFAREKLEHARANTVKCAIARLINYPEKLSVDEAKRQAIEMIADAKFWSDLGTVKYAQDEMRKTLGPYAY